MKTILHPDFWAKVPEGEAVLGISDDQRKALQGRFQEHLKSLPGQAQQHLLSALEKHFTFVSKPEPQRTQLLELQRKAERPGISSEERKSIAGEQLKVLESIPAGSSLTAEVFSDEETHLRNLYLLKIKPLKLEVIERLDIGILELSLDHIPDRFTAHVDSYYIARFPVTRHQYYLFTHGTKVSDLPSALEEPETRIVEARGEKTEISGRIVAEVQSKEALRFCEEAGGRLPTVEEWEKAARGTDGRLYPWGDEWNPEAGFFFYGQSRIKPQYRGGRIVDAFPRGVSPYGVWAMVGGLPELVVVPEPPRFGTWEFKGSQIHVGIKGCHARESSEAFAWLDHIVALPGRGDWVSLRPVLDEWPSGQWPGARAGED